MNKKLRVFSGMRPTGKLHLGHVLGALQNWVPMQDEYQCIFGIVDWHALTTEYENVGDIAENVIDVAVDWLAYGIDPEKSTLMIQSLVPEHAELHLLFSMLIPIPWLERVPTYKEQQKQLQGKDLSTYGFLGYPLLQAADILVYKSDAVPVGEDQLSHIELTREVARRFNFFFGDVFPEPQSVLTPVPRLPGLDGRKMSKSYGNSIMLCDSPQEVKAKILKMITDPARVRRHDPGNPDICPVYTYHQIFSPKEQLGELAEGCRHAGIGCTDCKKVLLQSLAIFLTPIYERRKEWDTKRDQVLEILREGSRKAQQTAAGTMLEVQQKMHIHYGR